MHQLDLKEYSFKIRKSSFGIYKNNNVIGNRILCDELLITTQKVLFHSL